MRTSRSATTRLAIASSSPALILELPDAELERTIYAVKLLSSTFRGASPSGLVGLDRDGTIPEEPIRRARRRTSTRSCVGPESHFPKTPPGASGCWPFRPASASPVTAVLAALSKSPRATLVAVPRGDRAATAADASGARPSPALLHGRTSPPTRRRRCDASRRLRGTRSCGTSTRRPSRRSCSCPRTPPARRASSLSGGPFAKATVENLASGVKRDFELEGRAGPDARPRPGPLAVVLTPAARAGGDTQGGRRRRRRPGPDRRRDHRARARLGGRPAREVPDVHRADGHLAASSASPSSRTRSTSRSAARSSASAGSPPDWGGTSSS